MTNSANIHASCIRIGNAGSAFGASPDAGVLLLGASGTGKSDLALQLIWRGAELVADDRTELFVEDGRLWARPPVLGAGLIEARGIGIVRIAHADRIRISLVVSLEPGPRLPQPRRWSAPAALCLAETNAPPWIALEYSASAAAKIALAAAAYELGLHRNDVNTI